MAAGTYYLARKQLPFSFLDTVNTANPKNFGMFDPQGLKKVESWWTKTWPKLTRVMLRGSLSFGLAGLSFPIIFGGLGLIAPASWQLPSDKPHWWEDG